MKKLLDKKTLFKISDSFRYKITGFTTHGPSTKKLMNEDRIRKKEQIQSKAGQAKRRKGFVHKNLHITSQVQTLITSLTTLKLYSQFYKLKNRKVQHFSTNSAKGRRKTWKQ